MTRGDDSIAFHAAGPDGQGYVLALERPEGGRVRARWWRSPDYTAAATEETLGCRELRQRIERDTRAGWRFTAPPRQILAWLDEA